MQFARRAFFLAGIYGVLVVGPMYFLEQRIGHDAPPPITHPEFFYGFVGVALAWQVAFFAIARDPVRLRPMMPFAVLEKVSFWIAGWGLFFAGRAPALIAGFAAIDLVWAIAFGMAWRQCRGDGAG